MTPGQIERIRKAAQELQSALNDPKCRVSVYHRLHEVTLYGDAVPKYMHEVSVTATTELKVFP